MDLMTRRRWLLQGITEENGWKKKIFIPSSDLLLGNAVVSAISAELPQNYHYAIALRHTVDELEAYAFVCVSLLPSSNYAVAIRKKPNLNEFQVMQTINSATYDVRIRSREQIDIYWREENIATDAPDTTWGYETLVTGAMSNAQSLKNALVGIGSWSAIITVADLDFNSMPGTNNTFCCCCAIDSSNMSGYWERVRSGLYNIGSSWTNSYDLIVDNSTKLANFYLV